MRRSQFLGRVCVATAAAGLLPQCVGAVEDFVERLDAYTSRVGPFGFSGSFLVARGSEIVFERGVGYADRATKVLLTPSSVIEIGSITKQFTAATILSLVDAGKLRTSDPLSRFFPNAPPDKRTITLHQLLTHTAGFEGDFGDDYDPMSRDALVATMLASKLQSVPGTTFSYSNAGYSLLAAIVELVDERGYEAAMHARILEPAGLNETGYVLPQWDRARIVHGYDGEADWGTPLDHAWAPDGPYWNLRGNGGLLTTLHDLYRWHLALRNGTILSAESRAEFFRPAIARAPNVAYAYGWSIVKTPRNTTLITHNGGNGVFFADFRRYIDEDILILLFSNRANPGTGVVLPFVSCVFGPPPTLPPKVNEHPGDPRALAGRYVAGASSLSIAADGNDVAATPSDPQTFAVISAIPDSSAENAQDRIGRLQTALSNAVKGNYAAWIALLRQPFPDVEQRQQTFWTNLQTSIGTISTISALGERSNGPGIDTFVHIAGTRGARYVRYSWDGADHIINIEPLERLPEFRFVGADDGTFVSYDLRSGKIVRLRFASKQLTIENGSKALALNRVSAA